MMMKGLYEAHLPVSDLKASIAFYEKLELTLAHENERVAFFLWIEKGKSWLGLWKVDINNFPYHPSTRHVAFQITTSSIEQIKTWLIERDISIHPMFGFSEEKQPLVLDNPPQFFMQRSIFLTQMRICLNALRRLNLIQQTTTIS
ncbi:hypothetical protein BsIDN1_32830 [Bacillus safensis]|uniref:VOC domain-containing protein n=1 Tax=Bacillus safensis TaxID=561879 RepID=A0A5S9M9X4_BACIA|nr:hypothetical protein BsIDN1_32830 [Bacillus safensis]